jgi:hypothetical protein
MNLEEVDQKWIRRGWTDAEPLSAITPYWRILAMPLLSATTVASDWMLRCQQLGERSVIAGLGQGAEDFCL